MRIQAFLLPAILLAATAATSRGEDPRVPDGKGIDAKVQGDVRVEVRGPVHEAFAQPFDAKPGPNKAIKKEPPQPVAEEPPAQRPEGANVQWIPGYWAWNADTDNFLWVSGMWRNVPEGRHWVHGFWSDTADGNVWVNGHWAAQGEQDFQFVPEPPATKETFQIGAAPDQSSFYIPGTWFYTDAGWQWRDGYWTDARVGYTWVPANYYWTPHGYIFTNGFWDYSPMNRGLLFAPVSFVGNSYLNPGYSYRPSYALGTSGLLGSLFLNRGFGQYFFGNYYGNQYSGLGYTPWGSYGARSYDPMYTYFGAARSDPSLAGLTLQALRANQEAIIAGKVAGPPATFAEAVKLNAATNANANVAAKNNLFIAPLANLQNVGGLKLTTIADPQRLAIQQSLQQQLTQRRELQQQFRAAARANSGVSGVNLNIPGVTTPNVNSGVQGNLNIPGVNSGIQGRGNLPGINVNPNGGGIRINPGIPGGGNIPLPGGGNIRLPGGPRR